MKTCYLEKEALETQKYFMDMKAHQSCRRHKLSFLSSKFSSSCFFQETVGRVSPSRWTEMKGEGLLRGKPHHQLPTGKCLLAF